MRKWYYAGVALLVFAFIGARMPKRVNILPQKRLISQPSSANSVRMTTKSSSAMKWRNPAGEIKEVGHGFITPTAPANASMLGVHNIMFDTKIGEPKIPEDMKAVHRKGTYNYYIIKCSGPILDSWKSDILNTGVSIEGYLPYFAYLVKATDDQMSKIKALPFISWTGDYHPYYKIVMNTKAYKGKVTVNVLGFDDADYNALKSAIQSAGGNIIVSSRPEDPIRSFRVEIDASKIDALAKIPDVFSVSHYVKPVFFNNLGHGHTQVGGGYGAGDTIVWVHNIKGQGQVINILDSGINTQHSAFYDAADPVNNWGDYPGNRKIVAYWPSVWANSGGPTFGDEDSNGYHGSHVNGIAVGDSTDFDTLYNGMAPKGKVYFLDGGGVHPGLYAGDFWDMYGSAYDGLNDSSTAALPETLRPRISSNSWGSSTYGDYNSSSYALDKFSWYHKDWVFFFAAGNGTNNSGAPVEHTTSCEPNAKDVVGVGATQRENSNIASYSSNGWTDDGRVKPDITAPGGDASATSNDGVLSVDGSTNNGYKRDPGTSMATPAAAGACLLVRQYFIDGWYPTGTKIAANDSFVPSAALMKAMMINGARDQDIAGPDSVFGWGDISLDKVLYFADTNQVSPARALGVIDNKTGLETGEYVEYQFTVNDTTDTLEATLVWTDYPSSQFITDDSIEHNPPMLVNDLDLTLISPSGTQYQCADPYAGTTPDRRNNVEDIVDTLPEKGVWTARVTGYNVPVSPQPFALVITYAADAAGVQGGIVSFDKPVYGLNDTVRISVIDNSSGITSPFDVKVKSSVLGDSELVSCNGTSGLYTGRIDTIALNGDTTSNNDMIAVSQIDTIWAYYTDNNSDGNNTVQTCSTFAWIDAKPFTISNVRVTNIQAQTADVNWNTSVGANGQVIYDTTTPPVADTSYIDSNFVTDHSGDFAISLSGLTGLTTYYYKVISVDSRGNKVEDDNAGDYYSFTTSAMSGSDILVLVLDGEDSGTHWGSPLPHFPDYFISAIEYAGWNYAVWKTSEHFGETPSRDDIKEFKAVFAPNQDEYPPILRSEQETLKVYLENGGRIAYTSHDFLWWSWDSGDNDNVAYDSLWMKNYCNARYVADITATGNFTIYGVSGDPISDAYSSTGAAYNPHRSGADGDSLAYVNTPPSGWDSGGTGSNVWLWDATNGYAVGSKWESGDTHGTSGDGVWGGYKTRTVYNGFVITQIDTTTTTEPSDRSTFINNELIWLIGHDHPDVSVTWPPAGDTITASPDSIKWTATAYGGTSIDSVFISYSPDGGQTWDSLAYDAAANLSSPYSWDISGLQNKSTYQVRVRVKDDGTPPLQNSGQTGNFTINIPGNDNIGPRVIPSPDLSRNPVYNNASDGPTTTVISATVTDSARGGNNIQTAQWDTLSTFATATTMSATDGAFDNVKEDIQDTIDATGWPAKDYTIYVRAQDASPSKSANNWGPADSVTLTVTESGNTVVELSQFTALSTPNGVKLYWRTESDAGTKSWAIERSLNKKTGFEKIGELSTKIGAGSHNYVFTDNTVEPPKVYYYRLASVYSENYKHYYPPIRVRAMGRPRPTVLAINSIHPNPFRNMATIEYQIPAKTHITLKVYDITGRCVRTLADNDAAPGYYTIRWNGKSLAAGVYYLRLETDKTYTTAKILLLK